VTSNDYQTDPDPKWDASLAALPPWKCGRLDMATWLGQPVQAGRVLSDVVKYVYFEGNFDWCSLSVTFASPGNSIDGVLWYGCSCDSGGAS